jgi:hypothetical protein
MKLKEKCEIYSNFIKRYADLYFYSAAYSTKNKEQLIEMHNVLRGYHWLDRRSNGEMSDQEYNKQKNFYLIRMKELS